MMAAQEIIELYCELISVRLPIIETQRSFSNWISGLICFYLFFIFFNVLYAVVLIILVLLKSCLSGFN